MTDGPRESGLLPVADGQSIYWEEWGAPDGVPALYLHGGPGGGLGRSGYRHRFDLERTRVIGLEQRGCGRSLPHASDPEVPLAAHTTQHLIDDIEALREARGVERWILNGVSWGSTLALAYAQSHPERVLGVVLFAVTTTRRREIDWITEGVGAIFPEAWDRFASFAEGAGIGYRRGEGRIVEAYARLVNSADAAVRDEASREWALWEDIHVSIGTGGPGSRDDAEHRGLPPAVRRDPRWEDDAFRLAFVRLTTHHWSHDGFLDPPLLENMAALEGVPAVLIHGRRDVSGPAVTAWELHRRWPGSTLVIDEQDGHGGTSMVESWSAANARLLDRVGR
ncbi:alpha/beta fold hydrolase [Brachybacterium halotolerans subsp. kimchii]|uniref:alpha/beta fold hydrolase n=1 Tax=Brachybacterium halotolerans TaxID=2795215 RepID=UPI001E63406C|nr:alpha/beta fold hydrolase [Brachybacterium halotolerans]UEJ82541.1 alpha/beta fold hydrolase [Brachybacterium halotolerans subsp. kimchii]